MKIGDKIKVVTKNGNKLCTIDEITDRMVHFKNSRFGLTVLADRIYKLPRSWYGAELIYRSFN